MKLSVSAGVGLAIAATAVIGGLAEADLQPSNLTLFANSAGVLATWHIGDARPTDLAGPFFRPLAAGGRSCGSCHRPAQGWTISAEEVKARFEATKGLDPIFRTIDGSNCDTNIDTSTADGRRAAYSLLLNKGLVRVALPVTAKAEFEVTGVENRYGCNSRTVLSMYRRPLPTTNLRFLSTVMWDGRGSSPETHTRTITVASNPRDLLEDLAQQALDASSLHAQTSSPMAPLQRQAIVNFEMSLFTAQTSDREAGTLDADGAKGGPAILATQTMPAFFVGINDPRAGEPHTIKAEDAVRLFDAWSPVPYGRVYTDVHPLADRQSERRASIARGQVIFDQKPFDIRDVAGINDDLNLPSVTGACGTCHNSPNVGNHSSGRTMNTGVSDVRGPLDVGYLPVITLRNKSTHQVKMTTDPGRALITGVWQDVGRVKVPSLRGLAGRAPYFHNGSANSLADVIDFYEKRFHPGFSPREKEDLIAFLSAL